MKTIWFLFFVSTGSYNHGTVTSAPELVFYEQQQCLDVAERFYKHEHGISGTATAMCIEVNRENVRPR